MAALVAVAALMLLVAGTADAKYVAGTPLTSFTGQEENVASVAIDQSTREVYVAEWGLPLFGRAGGIYRFDHEGNSLGCTLEPNRTAPGSVAVNPETGDVYVVNIPGTAPNTRLHTYPSGCGAEVGTEFAVEASQERPIPQAATDEEGNIYWPNPQGTTTGGKVQKFTPAGSSETLIEGLNRPPATALDSEGNIFVVTGINSATSCANGQLRKYDSEGNFIETLLEGNVLSVTIDRSTDDVFVGRSCSTAFHVEQYDSSGAKLADFGEGTFANPGSTALVNHLAVDETDKKVYAADPGNDRIQVYEFVPPEPQELTVEKTGSGDGRVTSDPWGINCGSFCTHEFLEGTIVLTAAVPPGNVFVGWTGCDETPKLRECAVELTEETTIQAEYSATSTLTVEKTGTGDGRVTSNPWGINCGSFCDHAYATGTTVTLTAAVPAGAVFKGWTGCDATPTLRTCEVTLSEDTTVSGEYAQAHLLTVLKGGSGDGRVTSDPWGINCGSFCEYQFEAGTTVTLTAAVGPGSTFEEWTGCDENPKPRECVVEMTEPKSPEVIYGTP